MTFLPMTKEQFDLFKVAAIKVTLYNGDTYYHLPHYFKYIDGEEFEVVYPKDIPEELSSIMDNTYPNAHDKYAIKILQWLVDNGQDLSNAVNFKAKEYLEEIKSELNTVKFMNYGVWFDSDQNTDKSLKRLDKESAIAYAKWCNDNNVKHPNFRRN